MKFRMGLLRLQKIKTPIGVSYRTWDQVDAEDEAKGELEEVYLNSEILRTQTLDDVRNTLESEETLEKVLAYV